MINEICLWIALPKCMMIRIIVVVMMYVQKSVFVDVEPTQIGCNRELFCSNSLNPKPQVNALIVSRLESFLKGL